MMIYTCIYTLRVCLRIPWARHSNCFRARPPLYPLFLLLDLGMFSHIRVHFALYTYICLRSTSRIGSGGEIFHFMRQHNDLHQLILDYDLHDNVRCYLTMTYLTFWDVTKTTEYFGSKTPPPLLVCYVHMLCRSHLFTKFTV